MRRVLIPLSHLLFPAWPNIYCCVEDPSGLDFLDLLDPLMLDFSSCETAILATRSISGSSSIRLQFIENVDSGPFQRISFGEDM